jgi:hypothetical protein
MKDPFSIFIEDSVYYSSNQYYKDMFKTKQLFFDCLKEKKSTEVFKEEASKIWGNIDHSYMKQRIEELEKMISATNSAGHKILNPDATFKEVFKIEPDSRFTRVEYDYSKTISKYYDTRLNTVKEGYVDEQTYMSELVKKYDDNQATIPYYNKDGTIRSYHNIASYSSMLFNTNLNRSGWNRTMYDAELLGNDLTYLPAHPFACPLCIMWQGRVYSISGKDKKYPPKENAIDGGVGHPNCRHQWLLYWGEDQVQDEKYNSPEWDQKYQDKQKIRSLELERSRLKNDRSIYEKIGNQAEADKVNSRIKTLNSKIKEINTKNIKTASSVIKPPTIPKEIKKIIPEKPKVTIPTAKVRAVNKDIVNSINEGAQEVANKYPSAFNDLTGLSYSKVGARNGTGGFNQAIFKPTRQGFGYSVKATVNDITIYVRETINDMKAFSENVVKNFEKGNWSTSNPKHTIYHELGHALSRNINVAGSKQQALVKELLSTNNKILSLEEVKSHLNDFRKIIHTNDWSKDVVKQTISKYEAVTGDSKGFYYITKEKVSQYGTTDYEEAFAELFAKTMNNDNDEITNIFKDLLDNKLEELGL